MNYKIVEWGDLAIQVPASAKWIAMDENGKWCWFSDEPYRRDLSSYRYRSSWASNKNPQGVLIDKAPPPEDGKWYEQIYWIG
jgi:hypothetical protein